MRPRSLVYSGFSGSTICFGSNIVVGVPYITMPIPSGLGLGLASVVVSGCSDLLLSLVLCVARVLQLEKPKQPISASSVPAIRLEMIFESLRFIHYYNTGVKGERIYRGYLRSTWISISFFTLPSFQFPEPLLTKSLSLISTITCLSVTTPFFSPSMSFTSRATPCPPWKPV